MSESPGPQNTSSFSPPRSPEPPLELLPSHLAASRDDVMKLTEILEEGGDLVDPKTNETPIHAAARSGAKKTLMYLLDKELADPTVKGSSGYTAAHYAAVYGYFDCLKLLLTQKKELSDQLVVQTDENGLGVLSLAVIQGDKNMVLWIMDNFHYIADVPNKTGALAIHSAAAFGHLDVMKLLVEKFGAEIAEKQDNQLTKPMYFAAQEGRLNIMEYLVNQLEVDAVARDKNGLSTLHAATQGHKLDSVKWLIEKLGSKYILDKTVDGATPLHMAASSGSVDILSYFLDNLENENDVDVVDNIHATPAHDAAEYGEIQAMLLLLQHGARIDIKDTMKKTPYEVAVEQDHETVAKMIKDYESNGPDALTKYEKKKHRPRREQQGGGNRPVHTSEQEAVELSSVIQQTTQIMDKRREQLLRRQESLQRMNEVGVNGNEEKDKPKESNVTDEDDDIEHTLGPQGDIYARPKRRSGKHGSKQNGDVDDFLNETMSHHSFADGRPHLGQFGHGSPVEDNGHINLETASVRSRRSRVRKYHDSDSDFSGMTGRSATDYYYKDGRHNVPGYYPGYPPPHMGRGPKSISSRHSSQGSHRSGYQRIRGPPSHMVAYPVPYGYPPEMMAPYYGGYPQPYWPQPGPYPMPFKTTDERMQMAMMQQQGGPPAMMQMPMGPYGHPRVVQHHQKQQKKGRRRSYLEENDSQTPKKHTDQDIGYGPSIQTSQRKDEPVEQEDFHPPAPPITNKDGSMAESGADMLKFDSNIIMLPKSDEIRQVGGITLNPTKASSRAYDGRYDQYIMTDSEEETDLIDETKTVAYVAESVCILAIGCVAGLKGLSRMRKGKSPAIEDVHKSPADRPGLSSAWDDTHEVGRKKPKKKHGADRNMQNLSPEEFASHEDWEKSTWGKKSKEKIKKQERPTRRAGPIEPQSELLTDELQKQSYASVSKHLGEKILGDALGAMHSSMLNISSGGLGSRMSLNMASDEENDDDDFDDAISLVHGISRGNLPKRNKEKEEEAPVVPAMESDEQEVMQQLVPEIKKKHKKEKKDKREKEKEKKGKKEKKTKEKKEKKEKSKKTKESKQSKAAWEVGETDKQESQAEPAAKPDTSQKSLTPPVLKAATPPKSSKSEKSRKASKKKTEALSTSRTEHTKQTTAPSQSKPNEQKPLSPLRKAPPPPKQKEEPIKKEDTQSPPASSKAEPSQVTGPKEVVNRISMLDSDSDEDEGEKDLYVSSTEQQPQSSDSPESLEFDQSIQSIANDLKELEEKQATPQKVEKAPDIIEVDDTSKEIFGEDGLAELNDVMRQLEDLQLGLTTDLTAVGSRPPPQPVTKVVAKESRGGGIEVKKKTSAVSVEDNSVTKIDTEVAKDDGKEGHHMEDAISDAQQTSSHATQGALTSNGAAPYSAAFEQNVLGILKMLNQTMQQMRANPSITQTEIKQQELLQQQMIQNMITNVSNQKDSTIADKLLALLKEQQTHSDETALSSKNAFEELEQKLIQAQQMQHKETQKHFRTQAEFQQEMQRKLEEQAEQQMKQQQSNFERYTKMLEDQLAEQRKRWEEEMRKKDEALAKIKSEKHRSKDRKHKKHKHHKHRYSNEQSSETSSADSDEEGLVKPGPKVVAEKPAVRTMQAKIFIQELLDEDTLRTSSQSSITKMMEKQRSIGKLRRLDTKQSFDLTSDALRKFEMEEQVNEEEEEIEEEEEEEEDEDEMQFQHARPFTLKRADIKIQDDSGSITPNRRQGVSQNTVAETRVVATSEEGKVPWKIRGIKQDFEKKTVQNGNGQKLSWMNGTQERCAMCDKVVYAVEKLETNNTIYHKTCFKCASCKKTLNTGNYSTSLNGEIYCTLHFKQLFQVKGNYSEGFGLEPHKNKWN